MLDVAYEDVIDNLEEQARRLIDYCGLPWDDRCLRFHETSRPIATTSNVQVRKPLYRSSLARWRRYEAYLGPLLAELQSCRAPWVTSAAIENAPTLAAGLYAARTQISPRPIVKPSPW